MKTSRDKVTHKPQLPLLAPPRHTLISSRIAPVAAFLAMILMCLSAGFYVIIQTREVAFESADSATHRNASAPMPFPLGVDPARKLIVEVPAADTYMQNNNASRSLAYREGFFPRLTALLTTFSWYQNLATPSARILIIHPGERKEEIASNIAGILGWSPGEKAQFMKFVASSSPEMLDGKFYPATYVTERHAAPETVASLVNERFSSEVTARYTPDIQAVVPLHDALTIASLLEREAYDFEDMRLISGVIWNRLFADMKLQIDATLQYARGSQALSRGWWPTPRPADKNIDSAYNTYEHNGLPPSPIANPSLDAIVAALNPKSTDCYFYFHDRDGGFHCSPTYEGHVALLKKHYGRGK